MKERGVVALIPLTLLIIVLALIFYVLLSQGIIKSPVKLPGVKKTEPTVSLQTQYANPFDKNSQYVNPFASYKNPFDALK